MRLWLKISLVNAAMFSLCGFMFGLLEDGAAIRGVKEGLRAKLSAAAATAANMAAADPSFASPQNLANAAEKLCIRKIEIVNSVSTADSTINPKFAKLENGETQAFFKTKKTDGTFVSARASAASCNEKTGIARILIWTLCGAFAGLLASAVIVRALSAAIGNLSADIFGTVSSKIRFSELDELSDTLKILGEINRKRMRNQLRALDASSSTEFDRDAKLVQTPLPSKIRLGDFFVEAVFANSKTNGAFFKLLDNSRILFGAMSKHKGVSDLEAAANAVLAREISAKLLETLAPKEAFETASKNFDFDIWRILSLSDSAVCEGFEDELWSKENLDGAAMRLLTTSQQGREMLFYSKLDFSNFGNKLDAMLKLIPSSNGGLFILLEKSK